MVSPTAFFLPYWIGKQFIRLARLVRLESVYFTTFSGGMLRAICIQPETFFGQSPRGFMAPFISAAHPCVYLGVFEVCAFDFLYILFAILRQFITWMLTWVGSEIKGRQ